MRIGCHDGARSTCAAVARKRSNGNGSALFERTQIEMLADNARGCHQNLASRTTDGIGDYLARTLRGFQANMPGSCIGYARIDGYGARRSIRATIEMLARNDNRRRAKNVRGERGSACARLVGDDQAVIETIGIGAETGVYASRFKPQGACRAAVRNEVDACLVDFADG